MSGAGDLCQEPGTCVRSQGPVSGARSLRQGPISWQAEGRSRQVRAGLSIRKKRAGLTLPFCECKISDGCESV